VHRILRRHDHDAEADDECREHVEDDGFKHV
jgi:hypothetical protein